MSSPSSDEKYGNILLDPITLQKMVDPVILSSCGHSFSEASIVEWMQNHAQCPVCKKAFDISQIQTNYTLRDILEVQSKSSQPNGESKLNAGKSSPIENTTKKDTEKGDVELTIPSDIPSEVSRAKDKPKEDAAKKFFKFIRNKYASALISYFILNALGVLLYIIVDRVVFPFWIALGWFNVFSAIVVTVIHILYPKLLVYPFFDALRQPTDNENGDSLYWCMGIMGCIPIPIIIVATILYHDSFQIVVMMYWSFVFGWSFYGICYGYVFLKTAGWTAFIVLLVWGGIITSDYTHNHDIPRRLSFGVGTNLEDMTSSATIFKYHDFFEFNDGVLGPFYVHQSHNSTTDCPPPSYDCVTTYTSQCVIPVMLDVSSKQAYAWIVTEVTTDNNDTTYENCSKYLNDYITMWSKNRYAMRVRDEQCYYLNNCDNLYLPFVEPIKFASKELGIKENPKGMFIINPIDYNKWDSWSKQQFTWKWATGLSLSLFYLFVILPIHFKLDKE